MVDQSQSHLEFSVKKDEEGQRLDLWLKAHLPSFSRSRIQDLIRKGNVATDRPIVRPHFRVKPDMKVCVTIPPPEPVKLVAEDLPLHILHEDGDLIVVDKPAGLVVHPAAGHPHGTLANALLYHCRDLEPIGDELRPGIVHRLDRDTSGVLIVAKNRQAHQTMLQQFKTGTVHKEYLALVFGIPDPAEGRIETLIGRHPHDRKKMSAKPPTGKPAITCYRLEEKLGSFALLRIVIKTGRTHQIRVHMAHIGHPVVGDKQYAQRRLFPALSNVVSRQMLHACRITFLHPRTEEHMDIVAPLPQDFASLLGMLREVHSGKR